MGINMKMCPKCNQSYNDNFSYCNICGGKLTVDNVKRIKNIVTEKRNITIGVIIVILIAVFGIGITISEQHKMKDAKQAIEDYKYEKALQEYISTPTTSDLRVNSDWTQEVKRNYIYINGSVTNTSSSKTISYFEVEAKFYDSNGNVIDSDWTNDGDDLEPGETRKFEMMHKYDSSISRTKLSIKDVN